MTRLAIASICIGAASLLAGCASVPASCRSLQGQAPQAGQEARIRQLRCLADRGAQQAQLDLARRYELGDGVPRDLRRAARLYERAAETIPATLPVYSPAVRRGGTGRVIFLANPNARSGSATARYRLGRLLIDGLIGSRDPRRGMALIEHAAAMGDPEARSWLRQSGTAD